MQVVARNAAANFSTHTAFASVKNATVEASKKEKLRLHRTERRRSDLTTYLRFVWYCFGGDSGFRAAITGAVRLDPTRATR